MVGVVRPAAVFVDEHFAGAQAFDFAARFVGIEQGADLPVSSGEVCPGEGDAVFAVVQAEEDVVALFVQKCVVGNRAGGDDARNRPFHRPFACRRVADLFADDRRLPQADEFGDVVVNGMDGDARHGNGVARRFAARGDADVEQFARFVRIFIKKFVKITHAVEYECVGVVFFDAEVLLHHRGVGFSHDGSAVEKGGSISPRLCECQCGACG